MSDHQAVIPDPGLTIEEAEALQVIHPSAEVRKLQDAGREKLAAALTGEPPTCRFDGSPFEIRCREAGHSREGRL